MKALPGRARVARAAVLLLPLLFIVPAGARQAWAQSSPQMEFDGSTEARVAGANALLGGVSAGLAALLRGDPPVPAIARGAGGGVLVYAGKRIAVDPRAGAGFLGRQVASAGGSIIGNLVAGRGSLDRIALAAGPVRAYIGHEVAGVDWRLDVPAAGVAAWGLIEGAELDLAKSLSSGTVVLREDSGRAFPGTIFYYPTSSEERNTYVLAHEQVHILQYDQSFLSLGDPFEDWLARRFPALRGTLDKLQFNAPVLATTAVLGFYVWKEHNQQLWEMEAVYLGRTR